MTSGLAGLPASRDVPGYELPSFASAVQEAWIIHQHATFFGASFDPLVVYLVFLSPLVLLLGWFLCASGRWSTRALGALLHLALASAGLWVLITLEREPRPAGVRLELALGLPMTLIGHLMAACSFPSRP